MKRILCGIDYSPNSELKQLKHILSFELVSYAPSIFELRDSKFALRSGVKSTVLDFLREASGLREWPENPNFEEERCLYGREAFVIDFMPLVRQKPPAEHETVEIYVMRFD